MDGSRQEVIDRAKALAKQLGNARYVYYCSPELGYVTRVQPPVQLSQSHWKITPEGAVYRHLGTADKFATPDYVPVKE